MDDGNGSVRDQMMDVFIFEANQLIEQLEEIMLQTENNGAFSTEDINEIFRIMHTIKGSSAMMMFDNISVMAHSVEDLFFYIRENKPQDLDLHEICDLVLAASDYIKAEVAKVNDGKEPDGDGTEMEQKIKAYLARISGKEAPAKAPAAQQPPQATQAPQAATQAPQTPPATQEPAPQAVPDTDRRFIAKVRFEEGGQMENVRAYTITRNLQEITHELYTYPKDIINSVPEAILENGVILFFATDHDEAHIRPIFEETLFLKSYELSPVADYTGELAKYGLVAADAARKAPAEAQPESAAAEQPQQKLQKAPAQNVHAVEPPKSGKLSLISVNVNKLDSLMNLVGEIVIQESMVTKNPDLKGLQLDRFNKAARQLRKLTDELQDIVMSIRMVPIAGTFQKMQRIVRDMSRKLGKDVEFVTVGEDTEVDKNIVDHLSDPLMHLIRNAMDHGVESEAERTAQGKAPKARVTLTAHNTGGDVMISVSDDGKGIDKGKILQKARERGLLTKPESEMSDKDIYALMLLPGFSTNEVVTEFSGRGVGMDVVKQNIEEVGGSISIKSVWGEGSTFTIRFPLTLAIADAMELSVGQGVYTLPTVAIKESFRAKESDIIYDNDGNEMIMIRGEIYPIIRLYNLLGIETEVKKLEEGILILIEGDSKSACIFADELLGEQQIVVKPMPKYLSRFSIKESGVEGCTIRGDGSISLILSAKGIISRVL